MTARLQRIGGGSVKCHRVRCVGTVRPNGLGDGSGKLGEQALRRWGSFNPVKTSGKDHSCDDFDFAFPAPRHVAQLKAKLNGLGDALVERGADQSAAQAEMAAKIPHRHEHLHLAHKAWR